MKSESGFPVGNELHFVGIGTGAGFTFRTIAIFLSFDKTSDFLNGGISTLKTQKIETNRRIPVINMVFPTKDFGVATAAIEIAKAIIVYDHLRKNKP